MGPRLRRAPQLVILHQLPDTTGLLGAQRDSLGQLENDVRVERAAEEDPTGHIWSQRAAKLPPVAVGRRNATLGYGEEQVTSKAPGHPTYILRSDTHSQTRYNQPERDKRELFLATLAALNREITASLKSSPAEKPGAAASICKRELKEMEPGRPP